LYSFSKGCLGTETLIFRKINKKPKGRKVQIPRIEANNSSKFMTWWNHRREKKLEKLAKRKPKSIVREWTELIVTVAVMVFLIRTTVVEAFRIPTGSMENTLLVGDFLLVNKFIYGIRTPDWVGVPFTDIGFRIQSHRFSSIEEPKQGDILVFRYPLDPKLNYIKRCIALPGQTVEVKQKHVFVDGKEFKLPPEGKFTSGAVLPAHFRERGILYMGEDWNKDNFGPVTVPEGHYFVMGDNRDNSADSRYWGFLPRENIVGKAMVIYFSWDKNMPLYRGLKKVRWNRLGDIIQ
jgi:signal peptidase I